ncbi:MAG: HAMP domain-containing histidine kinase [bacterium]|nr:HAMP domain-containing histidine kinase [bacterium]
MKNKLIIFTLAILFIIEISVCLFAINKAGTIKQDTIKVNEVVKTIESNYGNTNSYSDVLEYTVIDNNGTVTYKTSDAKSNSINEAIQNNDIILDLVVDEEVVGKVLISNNTNTQIKSIKVYIIFVICSVTLVQFLIVIYYLYYMHKSVIKPFNDLEGFAERVAQGNLDLPLYMDRNHVFGSFTESFDLMRSELKKARIAEKKANDDKKEIIAKLSHDIKTPIASIKSTSEIGYEISDGKTKDYFNQINVKTDQIKVLVDNLFNSSINEITEIDVNPSNYNSSILNDLIKNADYLNKLNDYNIPNCNIYIDKMRMQQTLDNIFTNSYKYANTNIEIKIDLENEFLKIDIRDFGPGVLDEEINLLKEKYKRGSNVTDEDGAGLGLHLANYFVDKMNGKLELYNSKPGFGVVLYIRTI